MNFVFLAGLGNSEPGHWQAVWYRSMAGARWVDHADWDQPNATDWIADLDGELRGLPGPKVLVAHSLGCLLAVEWARRHHDSQVKGSFLVAPPDVRAPTFPQGAVGFGPPGVDARPPLPAMVVASTDDPYASFESARAAAAVWGAELASVGARGHINLASNIGAWAEGRALLDRFVARLGPS